MLGASELPLRQGFACGKMLVRRKRAADPIPRKRQAPGSQWTRGPVQRFFFVLRPYLGTATRMRMRPPAGRSRSSYQPVRR